MEILKSCMRVFINSLLYSLPGLFVFLFKITQNLYLCAIVTEEFYESSLRNNWSDQYRQDHTF